MSWFENIKKWFRRKNEPPAQPIKIEVILNVPEIHIQLHGWKPEEGNSGPGDTSDQQRTRGENVVNKSREEDGDSITEDIRERIADSKISPRVPFGKENENG